MVQWTVQAYEPSAAAGIQWRSKDVFETREEAVRQAREYEIALGEPHRVREYRPAEKIMIVKTRSQRQADEEKQRQVTERRLYLQSLKEKAKGEPVSIAEERAFQRLGDLPISYKVAGEQYKGTGTSLVMRSKLERKKAEDISLFKEQKQQERIDVILPRLKFDTAAQARKAGYDVTETYSPIKADQQAKTEFNAIWSEKQKGLTDVQKQYIKETSYFAARGLAAFPIGAAKLMVSTPSGITPKFADPFIIKSKLGKELYKVKQQYKTLPFIKPLYREEPLKDPDVQTTALMSGLFLAPAYVAYPIGAGFLGAQTAKTIQTPTPERAGGLLGNVALLTALGVVGKVGAKPKIKSMQILSKGDITKISVKGKPTEIDIAPTDYAIDTGKGMITGTGVGKGFTIKTPKGTTDIIGKFKFISEQAGVQTKTKIQLKGFAKSEGETTKGISALRAISETGGKTTTSRYLSISKGIQTTKGEFPRFVLRSGDIIKGFKPETAKLGVLGKIGEVTKTKIIKTEKTYSPKEYADVLVKRGKITYEEVPSLFPKKYEGGVTFEYPYKPKMSIKESLPEPIKSGVIAHELGHFLYPKARYYEKGIPYRKQPAEIIAEQTRKDTSLTGFKEISLTEQPIKLEYFQYLELGKSAKAVKTEMGKTISLLKSKKAQLLLRKPILKQPTIQPKTEAIFAQEFIKGIKQSIPKVPFKSSLAIIPLLSRETLATPRIDLVPALSISQIKAERTKVIPKSLIGITPKYKEITDIKFDIDTKLKQEIDTRTDTKLKQELTQELIQRTDLKIVPSFGITTPTPPPPTTTILIPPKLKSLSLLKTISPPTQAGYHVYIKSKLQKLRKKKYQSRGYSKANKIPLSKNAAMNLLMTTLDTYSNRSGYIKKANRPSKKDEVLKSFLLMKFRRGKNNPNLFIEKSGYAIDSWQEKQAIPFEAARLRRAGLITTKRRKSQSYFNKPRMKFL